MPESRQRPGLAPIEAAIAAIAGGEMVVVVDSPDRENEGDLVMAAEKVTPEAVNFMATHGRGLICAPMPPERLAELDIEPMVANGTDPHGTAFHVGVDLRAGATTGISAADRAATLAALADPAASAADFTRPGHIFPLAARPAGCCVAPGTPRRPWTLRRWRACGRPASSARSWPSTAAWPACPTCWPSPPSTGCWSSRSAT